MVEQRAERLRANGHLGMKIPSPVKIQVGHVGDLVDAAHAIDRDLLDQSVGFEIEPHRLFRGGGCRLGGDGLFCGNHVVLLELEIDIGGESLVHASD
jgi:hypothetical protein